MGDHILCRIGLHKWKTLRKGWVEAPKWEGRDGLTFTLNGVAVTPIERACQRCPAHQTKRGFRHD